MKHADLELIPVRNCENPWEVGEDGLVTIHMVHSGMLDRVVQQLFFVPRVSHIDLDAMGSFLWQRMDGVRTERELAAELKIQYGQAAEPLLERLTVYLRILGNNRFIFFYRPESEQNIPAEQEKL